MTGQSKVCAFTVPWRFSRATCTENAQRHGKRVKGNFFQKNSHIWDSNSMTAARNPYYFNAFTHDTTGSTISVLEYSREEKIAVVSPRPTLCTVKHSKQRAEKPRDVYVTNQERHQAPSPMQLATWKFSPVRKEKYNAHSVADAFDAYQHRLQAKKWAEPKITTTRTHQRTHTHKKHVTINETATEIIDNSRPKLAKIRLTNRRNDEVKIDNVTTTKTISEEEIHDENDVIRIQKASSSKIQKPGFYGTIEAELCAEQAAAHLSLAGENLERLQFVTDAVYPQTAQHLKRLHEIDDDVKDFHSQMRRRRVKVPTSAGTTTQIAHFIINENN
ncbi:hypothetical protein B9Z55_021700 [Caenorhabditis nigoni]|uniref:Uncharacterized protein n=2 Tax=Caenorhabditis nigoni TaxID=1611254 RepID=A0A2G5TT69_9PELO|nr:hypothetical protein B9Z55_021700 [Caenorhabditis nigoni]